MKLLVTTNSMVMINVNNGKLFVEVYRKTGEIQNAKGQTLPTFVSRDASGKIVKDSKVAKFNTEEVRQIINALQAFRNGGVKAYQDYVTEEFNNPKFRNLMFPHNDRMAGLVVNSSKDGTKHYIGFAIKDGDDLYTCVTNKRSKIDNFIDVLTRALNKMIDQELNNEVTKSHQQKQKIAETNTVDTEEDIDIETEAIPEDIEEELIEAEETYIPEQPQRVSAKPQTQANNTVKKKTVNAPRQ